MNFLEFVTNIQNGMAGNLFFFYNVLFITLLGVTNIQQPPTPPILFFKPIKPSTVITFTHSFIPLCILLLSYLFVQCYTRYNDSKGNEKQVSDRMLNSLIYKRLMNGLNQCFRGTEQSSKAGFTVQI